MTYAWRNNEEGGLGLVMGEGDVLCSMFGTRRWALSCWAIAREVTLPYAVVAAVWLVVPKTWAIGAIVPFIGQASSSCAT